MTFTLTPSSDLVVNTTFNPRVKLTFPSTIRLPTTCSLSNLLNVLGTTNCVISG